MRWWCGDWTRRRSWPSYAASRATLALVRTHRPRAVSHTSTTCLQHRSCAAAAKKLTQRLTEKVSEGGGEVQYESGRSHWTSSTARAAPGTRRLSPRVWFACKSAHPTRTDALDDAMAQLEAVTESYAGTRRGRHCTLLTLTDIAAHARRLVTQYDEQHVSQQGLHVPEPPYRSPRAHPTQRCWPRCSASPSTSSAQTCWRPCSTSRRRCGAPLLWWVGV